MRIEVEGEAPKRKCRGEDIGVGQRALCKPDGIERGEYDGGGGRGGVEQSACQPEDGEERSCRDHDDERARPTDDEAGEVPPRREENGGQRRVSVGEGGLRDQRPGAEEVPRGRDVVAGLVPKVRQTKECDVREIDCGEEQRIEHPERDVGRGATVADG